MVTAISFTALCVVFLCVLWEADSLQAAAAVDAVVSTITLSTTGVTDIAFVSSTGDVLCVSANTNAVYQVTPLSSSTGQSAAQLVAGDPDSSAGFVNGVGINARFFNPYGITFDMNRNTAYISDYNNNCIRALQLPTLNVTTLSGTCAPLDETSPTTTGEYNYPLGVGYHSISEILFVVDSGHQRI